MEPLDDYDAFDHETPAPAVETTRAPLFMAMAVGTIAAILLTLLVTM
jgi:hypothetical protein